MDLIKVLEGLGWAWTAVTAVGAGLAVIPGSWVNERIKHRFARAIQRESAEHKASLDRDLEAYRTRLMSMLDEARLDIDLRRSVALQTATMKIEVVRKLATTITDFTSYCGAVCIMGAQERAGVPEELGRRSTAALAVRLEADIFVEAETSIEALSLLMAFMKLADEALRERRVYRRDDDAIRDLNLRVGKFSQSLRKQFDELLRSGRVLPHPAASAEMQAPTTVAAAGAVTGR